MSSLLIRGFALVAPFGLEHDLDAFLASPRSFLETRRQPDGSVSSAGPCHWMDEVLIPNANSRLRKQVDRSTLLAMHCLDRLEGLTRRATDDPAGGVDLDRVGLFIGSQFGGMDFSEGQLANLVRAGPRKVSAYQAISWFYAATQGQWTIAHQAHGHAKSFAGDFGVFVQMLGAAHAAMCAGRIESAFCGAADCCLTPYAQRIMADAQLLKIPLGEGGAFFWIAPSDARPPPTASCAAVVRISAWGALPLPAGAPTPADIDALVDRLPPLPQRLLLIRDGAHRATLGQFDDAVVEALQSRLSRVSLLHPKARYGHLLSAALPLDVAIGAHLLASQGAPAASHRTLAVDAANAAARNAASNAAGYAVGCAAQDPAGLAAGMDAGMAACASPDDDPFDSTPEAVLVLALSPYRVLNYVLLEPP